MKNSFISKTDLAQAYFPFIDPRSARHKLMNLINEDTVLSTQLADAGYRRLSREFSPAQVQMIFNRLGSPF